MSDLSKWLRWTAGELKTGPIEDGVLEAGMIQCADEIDRLQSQIVKRTRLLKECLADYGHPNFTDRHGMADRIRAVLSDEDSNALKTAMRHEENNG